MISLNILAYIIYGSITFLITVYVGWLCYKHGIHFIQEELEDNTLALVVNNLLLTGYYLLNLGYCTIMIYYWHQVSSIQQLIETVSYKTGSILVTLGVMHYLNMTVMYLYHKYKIIHSKI